MRAWVEPEPSPPLDSLHLLEMYQGRLTTLAEWPVVRMAWHLESSFDLYDPVPHPQNRITVG